MFTYDRGLMISKVRECFPEDKAEEVLAILDQYGTESYERERERVQIAILKLANGNLEELLRLIQVAKRDYRDVLAWAEYPEAMRRDTWSIEDARERERIRERDLRQYVEWLVKPPQKKEENQ